MKNFFKKLTGFSSKSLEKGFSLAEVMVATAILGIVITATVSQLQLSSKSAVDMAADAEINNVTNKVITAIGTINLCRKNFGGKPQNNTYDFIKDLDETSLIEKGGSVGTSNKEIKILNIETKRVSDYEMTLILSFQKKRFGVDNLFLSGPKREIPINTILDGSSLIQDCFANYDLVIRTAIQQSCKGLAARYNPNANPPYGQCEHEVKPLTCTNPGEFLNTSITSNGAIEFTCGKLTNDCEEGKGIVGFDAAGKPKCEYIFPTCNVGEVIVKFGGAHICKKLDCSWTTNLSAFNGFDPVTGDIICKDITTSKPCGNGQFVTNIDSVGTVTCSNAPFQGGTCGIGKYISGINSDGSLRCLTFIKVPFDCPAGPPAQAITGVKTDGTPDCEPINSTLKCGGGTRTVNACREAGGLFQPGANSHCKFTNRSTCPAPWQQCNGYRTLNAVTCRDTSNTFYCDEWKQFRTTSPIAPSGQYADQPMPAPVTCHHWVGSPGTYGRCDDTIVTGPTYVTQNEIGCY